MKIRLLSDLHTEFRPDPAFQTYFEYQGEDVLVLAGDIASGSTNVMSVIKQFLKAGFPEIIFVPGNHEYYGTEISDFDAKMKRKCADLPNVHFLNPGWVKIKDVIFVGGTLWTNFRCNPLAERDASQMIADFRLIKGFRGELASLKYYDHLRMYQSINKQFPHDKKVFISHFLPAEECISERFRESGNMLNYYFANNLGDWISELDNSTWLFGHTHDTVDINIGSTRLISNPYGYYGHEVNPNFVPFLTL